MQDLSTKEKTLLPITIETKFVTIFGATTVNTYITVFITFIDTVQECWNAPRLVLVGRTLC